MVFIKHLYQKQYNHLLMFGFITMCRQVYFNYGLKGSGQRKVFLVSWFEGRFFTFGSLWVVPSCFLILILCRSWETSGYNFFVRPLLPKCFSFWVHFFFFRYKFSNWEIIPSCRFFFFWQLGIIFLYPLNKSMPCIFGIFFFFFGCTFGYKFYFLGIKK